MAVDAHDDVDDVDNLAAFLWCDDDDDLFLVVAVAFDGGVAITTKPVQPWWKFLGKLVLRNLNLIGFFFFLVCVDWFVVEGDFLEKTNLIVITNGFVFAKNSYGKRIWILWKVVLCFGFKRDQSPIKCQPNDGCRGEFARLRVSMEMCVCVCVWFDYVWRLKILYRYMTIKQYRYDVRSYTVRLHSRWTWVLSYR